MLLQRLCSKYYSLFFVRVCRYSDKTRYNINHEATDYDRCNIFKIRVRKFIDSTDYSVKPIISEEGKVNSEVASSC